MKRVKLLSTLLATVMLLTVVGCSAKQNEGEPGTGADTTNVNVQDGAVDPGATEDEAGSHNRFNLKYKHTFAESEQATVAYRTSVEAQEFFTIDFKDGSSVIDMQLSGSNVKAFTVMGPDGREVKFAATDFSLNADNNMVFGPNTVITMLTAVEGTDGFLYNLDSYGEEDYFQLNVKCAYSPNNQSEVSSADELILENGIVMDSFGGSYSGMVNPLFSAWDFLQLRTWDGSAVIDSINVYYSGMHHELSDVKLNMEKYGYLIEGEPYDYSRERWNPSENDYTFELRYYSDNEIVEYVLSSFGESPEYIEIGDYYDKDGNIKDKKTALAAVGDYLMVKVLGKEYKIELPVYKYSTESVIYTEDTSYLYAKTDGELNILVIPLYFDDTEYYIRGGELENIQKALGHVVLPDGTETTYTSEGDYFTLSEYFEKASYGKLQVTSYITEPLNSGMFAADYVYSFFSPVTEFFNYLDYSSTHYDIWHEGWTKKLDGDNDNLYDLTIFIPVTGDMIDGYDSFAYGGAHQNHYMGDVPNTEDYGEGIPVINNYVLNNAYFLHEGRTLDGPIDTSTLIHEVGHAFGLEDYYDTRYSGYDAVGGYDMQSTNNGDWNPYSKFIVGWLEPTVLTDSEIEASVTVTIEASAEKPDAIVIPVGRLLVGEDGSYSPFNEYLMIDLFSPTGLNKYDASKYGLNSEGVRIYHVDGRRVSIKREWTLFDYEYPSFAFHNTVVEDAKYQLRIISATGVDHFTTGIYEEFSDKDLFKAGDTFSMSAYSRFFTNGLMDDGSEFPYTITIDSIKDGKATITITRN